MMAGRRMTKKEREGAIAGRIRRVITGGLIHLTAVSTVEETTAAGEEAVLWATEGKMSGLVVGGMMCELCFERHRAGVLGNLRFWSFGCLLGVEMIPLLYVSMFNFVYDFDRAAKPSAFHVRLELRIIFNVPLPKQTFIKSIKQRTSHIPFPASSN